MIYSASREADGQHEGGIDSRQALFEIGAVLKEEACEDGGWTLELKMAERDFQRFIKRENLSADLLEPMPISESAAAATFK